VCVHDIDFFFFLVVWVVKKATALLYIANAWFHAFNMRNGKMKELVTKNVEVKLYVPAQAYANFVMACQSHGAILLFDKTTTKSGGTSTLVLHVSVSVEALHSFLLVTRVMGFHRPQRGDDGLL
jgi:hypothetical protein